MINIEDNLLRSRAIANNGYTTDSLVTDFSNI